MVLRLPTHLAKLVGPEDVDDDVDDPDCLPDVDDTPDAKGPASWGDRDIVLVRDVPRRIPEPTCKDREKTVRIGHSSGIGNRSYTFDAEMLVILRNKAMVTQPFPRCGTFMKSEEWSWNCMEVPKR